MTTDSEEHAGHVTAPLDAPGKSGQPASLAQVRARLEQTSRMVSESLDVTRDTTSDISGLLDDVITALRRVAPRLAEITEVAARLEDVATQAAVAALNVSVEVCRGDDASAESLASMSDEVRRLAERTATATRRLTGLILELDEASSSADAGLTLVRARSEHHVEQLRQLEAHSGHLEDVVADLSSVVASHPSTGEPQADLQAARLTVLRRHLETELAALAGWGAQVPSVVTSALDEIGALLRDQDAGGSGPAPLNPDGKR